MWPVIPCLISTGRAISSTESKPPHHSTIPAHQPPLVACNPHIYIRQMRQAGGQANSLCAASKPNGKHPKHLGMLLTHLPQMSNAQYAEKKHPPSYHASEPFPDTCFAHTIDVHLSLCKNGSRVSFQQKQHRYRECLPLQNDDRWQVVSF